MAGGRAYQLAAASAKDLEEWVAKIGASSDGRFADDEAGGGGRDASDTVTRDAAPSMQSMASFSASGPLDELHSGWMKKKGQGMFGGKMQKRYFVLYTNKELHYFEGNSMDTIVRKGKIYMAHATTLQRVKPDDRKDFTFVIKVPARGTHAARDWVLDPGTAADWQEWESKLAPMVGDD